MADGTRYCFEQDEDCHWYMIPCTMRRKFRKLSEGGEDTEDEFIEEFDKYSLGGGISDMTFLEPKKLPIA